MKGKVVHCKREQFDVYVGRGRGSVWGNPFSHKEGTQARFVVGSVAEAIAAYRKWLWEEIGAGRVSVESLAELHGKTLGCWCKPGPCHGDVLVEAAEWAARSLEEPRDTGGAPPPVVEEMQGCGVQVSQ